MKSRAGLFVIFLATGVLSLGLWWYNGQNQDVENILISPVGVTTVSTKNVTPTPGRLEEKLIAELKQEVASASGTYAVYVYELGRKRGFGINEHVVMSGASLLKVPAMASVLRKVAVGEASLSGTLVLQEADRRLGAGPLQYQKAGQAFTFEKLVYEMGNKSDNTAWVMVNRHLGRAYISETMRQLGMDESDYGEVSTTAEDVGVMFTSLYLNSLKGVAWKDIREYLVDSIYEDRISVVLPAGVPLVHKVGTLEDAWMDAGVVERSGGAFVMVIMNTGVRISEAQAVVPRLANLIWKYENGK